MRTRDPNHRGVVALRLLAAPALLAGLMVLPRDRIGASGPVAEAYYMVIYAAQEEVTPLTSHCFATFARVTTMGRPSGPPRVELHHINWFSLRGHRLGSTCGLFEDDGRLSRPEPGENRTTREALGLATRRGLRVSRFGPYEIDRDLYERALRQIDLLEGRVSGRQVLYKALDLGYREGAEIRAVNCIHAISDIVREPAPLRTFTCYGDEAARRVVWHLRRWIKGGAAERPDVWPAIWDASGRMRRRRCPTRWSGRISRPAPGIRRVGETHRGTPGLASLSCIHPTGGSYVRYSRGDGSGRSAAFPRGAAAGDDRGDRPSRAG